MEQPFVTENTRERERLRALAAKLSDEDLLLELGDDWTIAAALAHLAFWDRRSLIIIRRWKREGVTPSPPPDFDSINDALLPLCRAIPPKAAANLAVISAESVDREIEQLSPELVAAIESLGDNRRIFRSIHRKMHLDRMEEAFTGLGHSL